MRDDADFAAYVLARWPLLVRSLVLIGCPQDEAEDVALTGLARSYRSWNRSRRSEDVDVRVYGAVVGAWWRRHQAAGEDPAPVLRVVAGLDEAQVAEVLDVPAWEVAPGYDGLLRRAEQIEVPPASYDAVVARAGELRRRRSRQVLAGAAVVVVAGAGLTWYSTRHDAEPDVPEVIETSNPIDQPWYGNGRLHLTDVAVTLPEVVQAVAVGGGVVVTDRGGEVSHVGPTGVVTEIGRTPMGLSVVASDERSWVAWLAADGEAPALVVHDVVDDEEVARIEVAADAVPVALDQNNVFFTGSGRTSVWEPLTGRVQDIGSRALLDVESAVRVYGDGTRIDMVQPFFNVDFRRPGATAELSPGGSFVLTRSAGNLGYYEPVIYDARSGNEMPSGLAPGELALDAAFGPSGTVDYLVVTSAGAEVAVLRTCLLGTSDCTDIVPLPREDTEPRLAH